MSADDDKLWWEDPVWVIFDDGPNMLRLVGYGISLRVRREIIAGEHKWGSAWAWRLDADGKPPPDLDPEAALVMLNDIPGGSDPFTDLTTFSVAAELALVQLFGETEEAESHARSLAFFALLTYAARRIEALQKVSAELLGDPS